MKHILKSCGFLILAVLGSRESYAQERSVNNSLRDLIGYYNDTADDVKNICSKVETDRQWEVKVWTYDSKTAYVPNAIQKWVSNRTKCAVLAIPLEDKSKEPQFVFSSDLEAKLDLIACEKIITDIVKPNVAKGDYKIAAYKGMEALLGVGDGTGTAAVEFLGFDKQKRGFDPNSITTYKYHEKQFGKPVTWKSLKKQELDKILLEYSGIAAKDLAFKVEDNSKITLDANLTTTRKSYNLSLDDEETEHTIYVTEKIPDGKKLGIIKTKAYKKGTFKVRFYVIHEDNDDVQVIEKNKKGTNANSVCVKWGINKHLESKKGGDDVVITDPGTGEKMITVGTNLTCDTEANSEDVLNTVPPFTSDELRKYLNDLTYGEANFAFEFVYIDDRTKPKMKEIKIDYDLNDNGFFDLYNPDPSIKKWDKTMPESIAIWNEIDKIKLADEISVIFLDRLKPAPDENLFGIAILGLEKNGLFVFPDFNYDEGVDILNTIAHEVGHAHFGLKHPWQDPVNCPGYIKYSDPANVMDYKDGSEFRKYQWDIISQKD